MRYRLWDEVYGLRIEALVRTENTFGSRLRYDWNGLYVEWGDAPTLDPRRRWTVGVEL